VGTDREHGDTSCLDIDNNPRLVRLRLPSLASVAQGIAVHDNAALVCSGQPSPQFPHAWWCVHDGWTAHPTRARAESPARPDLN
jgi:hypothetical protein